jgi:nucleoid DNA-binding protein
MKGLFKKEIAHKIRTDPRQRFYLRSHECEAIVEILLDILKQALIDGRPIDLDGFAKIFIDTLGPRKLYNYKLKATIDIQKSYMAKIKLKPKYKHEVKKAFKERDNA